MKSPSKREKIVRTTIVAYCFFEKRTASDVNFVKDGRLALILIISDPY